MSAGTGIAVSPGNSTKGCSTTAVNRAILRFSKKLLEHYIILGSWTQSLAPLVGVVTKNNDESFAYMIFNGDPTYLRARTQRTG
jgi:hypothetical protein